MSAEQTLGAAAVAEGKHGPSGGFLLFLLWLGVIGPAYSIGLNGFFVLRWRAMYPEAAGYYASWSFWWFIAAREGSRMLAALVLAARRSADAVWFAICILWMSGPALVTVTWLLAGAVIMPSALVRSTAIAAAATIYLLRSKQVRALYRLHPKPPFDAVSRSLLADIGRNRSSSDGKFGRGRRTSQTG